MGTTTGASPGHFTVTGAGAGGLSVNVKGAEVKTVALMGLPYPAAKTDSMLPVQGTWVQTLGRELDTPCWN